jgi:hypothetical protein
MRPILLVAAAGATALLAGCATGPATAWGKPNVSKVDYGTDIGMCTGLAAMQGSGNGANTAGGLNGQNGSAPKTNQGDTARASGANSQQQSNSGSAFPTGGGMYRDSAPQDVVQRAATQQQAQAMAEKRARADAFKSCIMERGYQEFTLTAEQRQHLATLKPGSNEYHEYLYKLGADPANLRK